MIAGGAAQTAGPGGGVLGIIAGSGELPRRLIAHCGEVGRPVFVLAIDGQTDPATVAIGPHAWTRLGRIGEAFDLLHRAGAGEVVFAGAVKRPSLTGLKLDAKGAALIARIGWRALGDDGLLRALSEALEQEGFRVIGAEQVLQTIVTEPGVLGRLVPDETGLADIARGIAVVRALGGLDIGQAAVVQQGIVLGVEAIEGTDALIERAGTHRRDGPGGVLVKLPKPGQDRRFDLPTIGASTVRNAAAAGLRGIAVEAGGTILLDRAELIARADRAGLFVISLPPPSPDAPPPVPA